MSSSSGEGDTSSQTSATLSETRSQILLPDEFDADRPPPRRLLVRSTQRSSSSSSETDTASVSSGEEEFQRQEEWNLLFQRILAPEREDSDGDETSDSDSMDSPRMRASIDSAGISGGSISARRSIVDAYGSSKRRASLTSPSSSPLFMLASEGSAIEDLTAQLREFLKHYNPRMPLDPENASALAEGFAETLRQVLTPQQYENATNVINSCCGQWIHSLFRLPAATRPVFVDSAWDGRLAIAKAAIQRAWPDYPQQGFRAFGDCIPTIYSSFHEPFLEQLRCHLGLPAESIRAGEDVVAMIEADLLENVSAPFEKRKLTPFLVFGHVGDIYDRFDDISRLQALCKNENIWLHIEGDSVVLLCQKHPPHDLLPVISADSILMDAVDICPGENINSVVVFYRRDAAAWAMVEKLGVATKRMQLVLWLQMQMLGRDNIINGIGRARHLVHLMLNRVDEVPYIELLAPRHPAQVQIAIRYLPSPDDSSETYVKDAFEEEDLPVDVDGDGDGDADDEAEEEEEEEGEGGEEGEDSPSSPTSSALKDASAAIPRPVSSSSLANTSNASNPSQGVEKSKSAASSDDAENPEWTALSPTPQARRRSDAEIAFEQALPYLNQINQQVLRDVISTIDSEDPNHAIPLEVSIISVSELDSSLVSSGSSKSYMRFAPLTSRALWQLSDAQAFRRACDKLAPGAIVFVQTRPPSLIGLGAVRYRPKLVADLATVAGPTSHEGERIADLIDELNEKIFLRLKRNKAFGLLFAEARSQEGSHRCISVQLDATPFTAKRAEQVAKLVVRVAQRVEDKIKFSERIGEIVAASVRVAQQKLKQESDRVRQEEGIIRKLPIVGSVLNWWSPVERNIRGQTFDLLSTSLEVHEKPPARAPQAAPAMPTASPSAKKVFLSSPSHPGLKPSSLPGSKSISKEMPAELIESSDDDENAGRSSSEQSSSSSADEDDDDDVTPRSK